MTEILRPSSLVDVGCGQGEWLAAFAELGVSDYHGVDGAHVADHQLRIPRERFTAHDLTRPLRLGRRFDVVLSLEVAEHLPARVAADFVSSLIALAPAVVFSAAIPGQGGVHHVNEQWPWYWKERFAGHGFIQLDPFRKIIWHHPHVASYYQQNLFLYVDPAAHKELAERVGVPDRLQELTLVRTTILQDMTKGNWVLNLCRRACSRARSIFARRLDSSRNGKRLAP